MSTNKHVEGKTKRRRNKKRFFKSQIRELKKAVLKTNNIPEEMKKRAIEKINCISRMAKVLDYHKIPKTIKIPSLGIKITKEGVEILEEK